MIQETPPLGAVGRMLFGTRSTLDLFWSEVFYLVLSKQYSIAVMTAIVADCLDRIFWESSEHPFGEFQTFFQRPVQGVRYSLLAGSNDIKKLKRKAQRCFFRWEFFVPRLFRTRCPTPGVGHVGLNH